MITVNLLAMPQLAAGTFPQTCSLCFHPQPVMEFSAQVNAMQHLKEQLEQRTRMIQANIQRQQEELRHIQEQLQRVQGQGIQVRLRHRIRVKSSCNTIRRANGPINGPLWSDIWCLHGNRCFCSSRVAPWTCSSLRWGLYSRQLLWPIRSSKRPLTPSIQAHSSSPSSSRLHPLSRTSSNRPTPSHRSDTANTLSAYVNAHTWVLIRPHSVYVSLCYWEVKNNNIWICWVKMICIFLKFEMEWPCL